ncbi:hypothetical protein Hanom_Chr12g01136301 [Helianthus anomalus]
MHKLVNVYLLFELCRNASENNELHDAEVGSARRTAKEDALKNSEDITKYMEGISQKEQEVVHRILEATKAQAVFLEFLQNDHSTQSDETQ